jgi:asparagine synthase (glutamine-hydrolysing)
MAELVGTFFIGEGQGRSVVTAPGTACAEQVSAALQGRPRWKGEPESEAGPVTAERVLRAFLDGGPNFLQSLDGSFALAILDPAQGYVLLAIDRMGIERLAYAMRPGELLFSTSAETVARSLPGPPRLNSQALFSYLFFHMVPAPQTIFEGVSKLPAGHAAEFRDGRIKVFRYWNPGIVDNGRGDETQLKAELHQSLKAAVRDARPGPATGAFLSGGLDSSTVAGVLSEVGTRPAKTFSIGFGYADYDELGYARIANRHFGCEGHEYTVHGADIAESFPRIARAYDEPFGNSSALPAYYCARLAKDAGVDHLLAGDGGDELFAGNSRYADQQVFEWYGHVPGFMRRGLLEPALAAVPQSFNPWLIRKARGYVEKATVPLPARLETWNFVYRLGPAEILDPGFLDAIDPWDPFAQMQRTWDEAPCRSTLNKMLFYDWRYTLADNDLRKVQTMCELAGVKVSYPMLHADVVEFSCRVPPDLKMPGRKLRHFYKQSMSGFLPDEIIHKKKHGFGLPFGLWLQESAQLRQLIFDNLSSLRARGMIRPEFIDRLLDLHGDEDARYYGVFIWVLAMLEQWLREHELGL